MLFLLINFKLNKLYEEINIDFDNSEFIDDIYSKD